MIPSTILTLELICQKLTRKSLPLDILLDIYDKTKWYEWYLKQIQQIENEHSDIDVNIIMKGAKKKKFKKKNKEDCSKFRMKQAFRWSIR